MKNEPERIMSGDYSRDMWEAINSAKTKGDLRRALYFVCCRLQELESRLTPLAADAPPEKPLRGMVWQSGEELPTGV